MYFLQAITTVEDSKSNPSRHDFHSPAPFASNVPKFGREIPNRVFVGALDANVCFIPLCLRKYTGVGLM